MGCKDSDFNIKTLNLFILFSKVMGKCRRTTDLKL